MQREKTMLIFCDVVGTYGIVNKCNSERKQSIKHFIHLLESLRKFNNDDKILFSFISLESLHCIIECINEIKEIDEGNYLTIENSFYDSGKIEYQNGNYNSCSCGDCFNKPNIILNQANFLSNKYNIDKIYYFDDTEFYHILFDELKERYDIEYDIVTIMPKSLNDLNNRLESNINENYSNKVKIMKKETI